MQETPALLEMSDFPAVRRARLETLQVNLGYRCNQQCVHCHVNAGPARQEMMGREVIDQVIAYLEASAVKRLDLTGGAPELNPHFRHLVHEARKRGVQVMDRCNLTILEAPGQEGLADFLAQHQVEVIASLPCYLQEGVDAQRGEGTFAASIRGLKLLNQLGYGHEGSPLRLNLVYNPGGPFLPPSQKALEEDFRKRLGRGYDIVFHSLLTLVNMPIQRFANILMAEGRLQCYLALLREAHQEANLEAVMCRSLISLDWQGIVYDCDFNQMLGLPMRIGGRTSLHLSDLAGVDLEGHPIVSGDHCFGCTAGQGSSCCGALS